jgi:ATP-dependent DNA ligase
MNLWMQISRTLLVYDVKQINEGAKIWPSDLIEIKHDGFRIIARKSGGQLRLYSRPG